MNTNITIRKILALFLSLCLFMSGTAYAGGKGKKNFNEGKKYEAAQQWDLAAQAYALAVSAEPNNPEYRLNYLRALQQASLMYVKRGDVLAEQNDFAGAYTAYRTAFQYDQGNEVARIKMERMLDQQKAIASGLEPINYNSSGNVRPTSDVQIASRARNRDLLTSINFNTKFKSVVKTLCKQMDLNVLFDDQVKDEQVDIELKDVTLAKALDQILLMKKYTFEQLDRRTIIIYPDNPTNKPRFEKLFVKAFYLGNIDSNAARNAITLALGNARQVTPLSQAGPNSSGGAGSNVVLVKATPQELQLVQDLISLLDKNKNEVVLDVEIYEVSHDSLTQIGNQIATSPIDFVAERTGNNGQITQERVQSVGLNSLGGIGLNINRSTAGLGNNLFNVGLGALIGLPPTTLSLLQSKGNSKLLYKTQIHVLDGQPNTTKVGRSVPVRLGTQYGLGGFGTGVGTGIGTGAGGGGIGTGIGSGGGLNSGFLGGGLGYPGIDSIQYRDVGLVIEATPQITNEGYVEVKMKFETSDVLASGSDSNLTPTFTQRSLQTVARIKDGVTSVVAGVNQESKGDSRATIPVIGMLPILGRLFTTPRQESRQSDIVITVTPHIVRSAGITEKDYLAFQAGSGNPTAGGLAPSIEDVVYRAQQEEEQERRLIAQQSPQLQNVPITADSQYAVNQSPRSAPMTDSRPPIQTVANNNTGAPVERRVLDNKDLVPVRSTSNPSSPVQQYSGTQFPEPPPQQQEVQQNSASDSPGEITPGREVKDKDKDKDKDGKKDKDGQEGEFKEGEMIKPEIPVEMAIPRGVENSEERQRKMEIIRKQWEADQKKAAEEAKARKSGKVESAPAPLPPEIAASVPKTKVERALPTMGASNNNISFSLSPTPIRGQMGKTFSVTVQANGQGQMTGASIALRFDEKKMQVKSVRGGDLFGNQPELTYDIQKGTLKVSVKHPLKSSVSANGKVIVIEFSAIAEGSSEIAFSNGDTKVNTDANSSVPAKGGNAQVVISRDAVASSTNER